MYAWMQRQTRGRFHGQTEGAAKQRMRKRGSSRTIPITTACTDSIVLAILRGAGAAEIILVAGSGSGCSGSIRGNTTTGTSREKGFKQLQQLSLYHCYDGVSRSTAMTTSVSDRGKRSVHYVAAVVVVTLQF